MLHVTCYRYSYLTSVYSSWNKYGSVKNCRNSSLSAQIIFICLSLYLFSLKMPKCYPKLVSDQNGWCRERGVSAVFGGTILIWAGVHQFRITLTRNTEHWTRCVGFWSLPSQSKSVLEVLSTRHDKDDLAYTMRSCWEFWMDIFRSFWCFRERSFMDCQQKLVACIFWIICVPWRNAERKQNLQLRWCKCE